MKRKNNAMTTFTKDAKSFAFSVANHNRIIGEVTGYYDTYKKGQKLAKSGSNVVKAAKKQVKSRINRSIRKYQRYL
jgi:hypothetical protein